MLKIKLLMAVVAVTTFVLRMWAIVATKSTSWIKDWAWA